MNRQMRYQVLKFETILRVKRESGIRITVFSEDDGKSKILNPDLKST